MYEDIHVGICRETNFGTAELRHNNWKKFINLGTKYNFKYQEYRTPACASAQVNPKASHCCVPSMT